MQMGLVGHGKAITGDDLAHSVGGAGLRCIGQGLAVARKGGCDIAGHVHVEIIAQVFRTTFAAAAKASELLERIVGQVIRLDDIAAHHRVLGQHIGHPVIAGRGLHGKCHLGGDVDIPTLESGLGHGHSRHGRAAQCTACSIEESTLAVEVVMPCLVAHGISVLTAVDKAHGEGREAQSAVVIGHRHGIVIVDGNGDKIIRVDCLQIFDGQDAQRTPAAPGARALLDDDTLARHKGGAHRGVADAHGNRPLYCGPQVVADVVALIGERQGGGQGKFVGIAVVKRQTVESSRNGTARCVAEVSGKGADVTFGQECSPDGQLGFGGHVGQPAFHGKCSVETYADVVDAEDQAVVSLIDKGYPNGLAGIGVERQAVLVPLSVQIV